MPKTIKYIGTQDGWAEIAVTGRPSNWKRGAIDERSDLQAAQLLATGLFTDVDATLLPEQKVVAISGVVSKAGIPPDTLVTPLQHVHLNAAMSSTAVLTATAIGTYNKARVVWNNNGASASAKLRIAVNADNDVHGLMVAQSAKRRDYEMTMGDGVILVCADPITTLAFSADGAIGSGLHSILVTFGA